MKQYDEILVACDDEDPESCTYANSSAQKNLFNVIVLTIKELMEVWEAAEERGDDDRCEAEGMRPRGEKAPDFKTYLQSKGITP